MKIVKEQSTAAYYESMAELTKMKIASEEGKAQVLKSDAALRNLSLVDAVEGKDIQKQKELEDHKFNLELGKMGANALLNAGSNQVNKANPNDTKNTANGKKIPQTNESNKEPGMTDTKDIPSEALRT